MKNYLFVALVGGLIATMAGGAKAVVPYYKVDFDGTKALTTSNNFAQPGTPGWHFGWDQFENPTNGFATSDLSHGIGGALRIDDTDPTSSSHMTYDVGEHQDGSGNTLKAGGTVVARAKVNGSPDTGVGFGYSSSDGGHTGILGLKNGAVSITGSSYVNGPQYYDTNGAAAGNDTAVPGGTASYRTYALTWSVDFFHQPPGFNHTRYDVYVLNNPALTWSSNPADWTQIITDLQPRPLADGTNAAMNDLSSPATGADPDQLASGVMMGSFGPGLAGNGRSATGVVDFDWLVMQANTPGNYNFDASTDSTFQASIKPWVLDYSGIPQTVPEPTTLGLMGLAGLAVLRKSRRGRVGSLLC